MYHIQISYFILGQRKNIKPKKGINSLKFFILLFIKIKYLFNIIVATEAKKKPNKKQKMIEDKFQIQLLAVGDRNVSKKLFQPCNVYQQPTILDNTIMKLDVKIINQICDCIITQESKLIMYPDSDIIQIVFSVIDQYFYKNIQKKWHRKCRMSSKRKASKDTPINKQTARKIIEQEIRCKQMEYDVLSGQGLKKVFMQPAKSVIKAREEDVKLQKIKQSKSVCEIFWLNKTLNKQNKNDFSNSLLLAFQIQFQKWTIYQINIHKIAVILNIKYQILKLINTINQQILPAKFINQAKQSNFINDVKFKFFNEHERFLNHKRFRLRKLWKSLTRQKKEFISNFVKQQSQKNSSKSQKNIQMNNQQLFAIKSVLLTKLNQKQKDNALNQVRLLASIHIPYVIGYRGAFFNNQNQCLCVVMEYADGGDLQHQIQGRKKGFQQTYIWKVAYQLLNALKMLHHHKIVHRDIKAANVFFAQGIAKLGDMNVSKVVEQGYCQTQTGTPYYTSPQIWKGQKYTEKCDIWSLGCLIYEMCVLKPPFRAKDFPSLYKKVIVGQYDQIPKQYSSDLKLFIRQCLNVNQVNRPGAKQLLQTNILSGMELSLQRFRQNDNLEIIQLIDPIKCPRVLKFLNTRLPKNQFQNQEGEQLINFKSKKNVGFATKKQIQKDDSLCKESRGQSGFKCKSLRKIRSQKSINLNSSTKDDTQKVTKNLLLSKQTGGSKKLIKLPPLQKQISLNSNDAIISNKSQKQIQSFSSKKIKNVYPNSNMKILPDKQNKKLFL